MLGGQTTLYVHQKSHRQFVIVVPLERISDIVVTTDLELGSLSEQFDIKCLPPTKI